MFNLLIAFAIAVGTGEGNNLTSAASSVSVYRNLASCEASKVLEISSLEAAGAEILSAHCTPQKVKKVKHPK